jgi:hypothetical protein
VTFHGPGSDRERERRIAAVVGLALDDERSRWSIDARDGDLREALVRLRRRSIVDNGLGRRRQRSL